MFKLVFEIPNDYGHFLKDILQCININEYVWKIGETTEILVSDTNENLFENTLYNGDEFKMLIDGLAYVIFADIKAYPQSEILPTSDFDSNSFQFSLIVVDCSVVEIYSNYLHIIELFRSRISCNTSTFILTEIDEINPSSILDPRLR